MNRSKAAYEECAECRGRGYLDPDDQKLCPKCGGTGMVVVARQSPEPVVIRNHPTDPWWD